MYKVIGTWSWPDDLEAFEDHYWNVHMPIARAVPGLQGLSTLKAERAGVSRGSTATRRWHGWTRRPASKRRVRRNGSP